MNAKTNKLLIPAIIIGGGVALYFLNKKGKLDKIKALISGEKEIETTNPVAPVITGQTTVVTSNPLGNAAAVKKFQEYYNSVKPANLPALAYTGWGPLTAAAYNSYKDLYATAAAAGTLPAPTTTLVTIIPFKIGDTIYSNQDNPIKAYSDVNSQIFMKDFYKGELIGKIDLVTPFSNQYKIRQKNGTFYTPLPDSFFYVDSNKGYKK